MQLHADLGEWDVDDGHVEQDEEVAAAQRQSQRQPGGTLSHVPDLRAGTFQPRSKRDLGTATPDRARDAASPTVAVEGEHRTFSTIDHKAE
ncbi:hypothetical protein GCM10027203_44040 [Nonomuraea fastidiosa]